MDCGKSFTHDRYLKGHQLKHEHEQKYRCTFCDKLFFRQILTHSEKNPLEILKMHEIDNTEEKPHVCTEDEVSYHSADQLQRHLLNHSMMKPVNCTECSFIYYCKTQQDLQTQIRIHIEEKHQVLEEETN